MYKLTESPNIIFRIHDNTWIPADVSNSSYVEYLKWLNEGNTPLPVYTEQEIAEKQKKERISELKSLLLESDFRMTTDYYESMSLEDQIKWKESRSSWRDELRSLLNA